ncbi:MAG: extracellular solute-binding protein [Bacilli bacterium]|jgi:multiple sugar transport system substrate-binding protein|nr:extracellular solute-binding protein [Bacilli bacterium]MCH4201804.1 extracellular solute-binding protein [Bacilli bacterium]MCH4236203.1 extracellular solute-binding protein [Bacilli bacterium]
MKNKVRFLSLSVLTSVALLSGCGNKKSITFWTGFGATVNGVLQPLIDQFQKDNPEFTIKYETKGGYDNLQQAINLSVSNSAYPNIAVGYPDHMASYMMANILLPLDSYIAGEDGVDLTDFNQDYLVENQSLAYHKKTDGTNDYENPYTMGLPFNKSTEVMVANQTFVDWIITKDETNTIKVPETWQEAKVVGEKILAIMKDGDYYGKYIDLDGNILVPEGDKLTSEEKAQVLLDLTQTNENNFRPFSWDSTANFFITIVRDWGGTYTEMGNDIRSGYLQFDSAETRAALSFFQEMAHESVIGVPQNWGESSFSSTPFNANKTIFTISSSAGVTSNIPPNNAFKVSINAIPFNQGETKYVISQGTNLMLFDQGSDEAKAYSWKLIKYLTTQVNDRFALGTAYYPVTKTMANTQTYLDFLSNTDGKTASQLAVINAAQLNVDVYDAEDSSWVKFVDPGFYGSSEIRSAVSNIVPRVFNDEGATVDGVLADVLTTLKPYIKK